jgi:hypothetical protein
VIPNGITDINPFIEYYRLQWTFHPPTHSSLMAILHTEPYFPRPGCPWEDTVVSLAKLAKKEPNCSSIIGGRFRE